MSESDPIMLVLALLSCLASCVGLFLSSRGSDPAHVSAGTTIERFLGLLGLKDIIENPTLVMRLKQAGFSGRSQARLYIMARIFLPLLTAVAGYGFATVLSGSDRMSAWAFLIVLASGLSGLVLPDLFLSRRIKHRQSAIRREWPDMLDMVLLSIEGGMGLDAALREVTGRIGDRAPILCEELNTTLAELVYLADRKQALANLANRVDLPSVSLVVTALLQAERYGSPIATALRTTIRDQRATRMYEAERKAASLPAQLTIPMIAFFLPILFVLIFTPAILHYLFEQ